MLKRNVDQLSKRELGIILALWITGHTASDHLRQPFLAQGGVLGTVDGKNLMVSDPDFLELIDAGYVEPIQEDESYIFTTDTDDIFDDVTTEYRERLSGGTE